MTIPPDKAVFTATMVTLGSTMSATVLPPEYGGKGKLPSAKQLIGTSLTFIGLGIMADIAPKVAVGLAASMAVTALTYYGIPVADAYFNGTTATKANTNHKGTNK